MKGLFLRRVVLAVRFRVGGVVLVTPPDCACCGGSRRSSWKFGSQRVATGLAQNAILGR